MNNENNVLSFGAATLAESTPTTTLGGLISPAGDAGILKHALMAIARESLNGCDYSMLEAAAREVWQGRGIAGIAELAGPYRTEAVLFLERLALLIREDKDRKHALLAEIPVDWEPTATEWRNFDRTVRSYVQRLWPLRSAQTEADAAHHEAHSG